MNAMMAASALEEKINKIRQQNEEIRRRHEEVEEDKKNAAKLNALVQMVPSTDWPERKEPPEFSNPSRTNNKLKPAKEHHEHSQQYQSMNNEGRKVHMFAQGQGPPPDPKYNFLADAEREEGERENTKDNSNKGQKYSKNMFRRKSGGKDNTHRDYKANKGSHRDEHQPEYEAWRAERNRIDEDRISRQRTAEGNWRREWDNDKVHIVDEVTRSETKLGDYVKKDYKDFDKRYHVNGNDYVSHNRGGHRSYRGNSRHFYNNYENSSNAHHQNGHNKNPSNSEKRTVVATDKSIKVTLNQGNMTKGPLMSVKVNSPSIAGTGRVGPRQRSRVTYSSHSDVEVVSPDIESFSRSKPYEDKTKDTCHENQHKSSNLRKSQLPPKKKDFSNKSPYFRKKEIKKEDENLQKHLKTELPRQEHNELQKSGQSILEKPQNSIDKIVVAVNEKENNTSASGKSGSNDVEINDKDNQNNYLNSYIKEKSKIHANKENEFVSHNSNLSRVKNGKLGDESNELLNVQEVMTSECEIIESNLTSSVKDDNEIKCKEHLLHNADKNIKKTVMKNEDHSSEQICKEILSDNCDNEQIKDISEQENDMKSSSEEKNASSTNVHYEEQNDTLKKNEVLKKKENLIIENKTVIDKKANVNDTQNITKYITETQECIDNKKGENSVTNSVIVDKIESLKNDLHIEKKRQF